MAKGQKTQRSRREKPKKERLKVALAAPSSAWRKPEDRQPSLGLGKRK
jgi:hypothetical protein